MDIKKHSCDCGGKYGRHWGRNLRGLRSFCIEEFPFLCEDFDSLTTYELLSKVICFLKAIGVQVEELTKAFNDLKDDFNELEKFVLEWFDNLDVQEEINNKLDEMANNGELEAIFTNFKQFTGQKLNAIRLFSRYIKQTGSDTDTYWQIQGIACPDKDTIIYGLCSKDNENLNGLLVRQSISTGVIERETLCAEAGHINDMTIYKGMVVLTPSPMSFWNAETQSYVYGHNHKLEFYDPVTFEHIKTLTIEGEGGETLNANGVCSDGEHLYIYPGIPNTGVGAVWEINPKTGKGKHIVDSEDDEFEGLTTLGQGIEYYQGKFLRPYGRPFYIKVFSKTDGKIVHRYELPFVNNGVYSGELEGMCNIPGTTEFLLSCFCKNDNLDNSSTCNIYRCDFQKGYLNDISYRDFGITQGRAVNFYVDINGNTANQSNRKIVKYPIGTSGRPFLTIQDAIDAVRQNEYKAVNIKIKGSGTYSVQCVSLGTPIIIEAIDDAEVTLNDSIFQFSNIIHFRRVKFTCSERDIPLSLSNINLVRLEECIIEQKKQAPAIRAEYIGDFYTGSAEVTGGTYSLEAVRTHIHGVIEASGYTRKMYYIGSFSYFDSNSQYTMNQTYTSELWELSTQTSKVNGASLFYGEDPQVTGTVAIDKMGSKPTFLIIEFQFRGYYFVDTFPIPRLYDLDHRYFTHTLFSGANTYIFNMGLSFTDGNIVIETNRRQVNGGSTENATSDSTSEDFMGIKRVFAFYN